MVVACAGHTCINRTSFGLLNLPNTTIAVAQIRRKASASEAKNLNHLSLLVTACHSLTDWPFRRKWMWPLPVFVPPPHYVHNCGENAQGTVWHVRGPCCFSNKPQLHGMVMTRSPTAERKTRHVRHFNADTRLETKAGRAKALFYVTWLRNSCVCCVCSVFFGDCPNNPGESRDCLLTNKVPFSETWQL